MPTPELLTYLIGFIAAVAVVLLVLYVWNLDEDCEPCYDCNQDDSTYWNNYFTTEVDIPVRPE